MAQLVNTAWLKVKMNKSIQKLPRIRVAKSPVSRTFTRNGFKFRKMRKLARYRYNAKYFTF